MNKGTRRVIALLVLVAAAVAVAYASTEALSGAPTHYAPPPQTADHVSNRGSAVAVDASLRGQLERAVPGRATGVSVLGTRGGWTLYAIEQQFGTCYASGRASAQKPVLGTIDCPTATSGHNDIFPSLAHPISNVATSVSIDGSGQVGLDRLGGVAADGIASVGVETVDGAITAVPVTNNVYFSDDVPHSGVKAIVAMNATGDVVYTMSLERG